MTVPTIFTGYFYQATRDKGMNAVSIAVGQPKYVDIHKQIKSLAPSWNLLNSFRNQEINQEQYIERYTAQLDRIGSAEVLAQILRANNETDEVVLMCHCGQDKFCHRHILAEWLENEQGIDVPELGRGLVTRSKGYIR